MRFMVQVRANEETEAGVLPSETMLLEMGAFNEELIKRGVMLAGEGLKPSRDGARIRFQPDGKATVIDGPFAEAKELIAGYWLVEFPSKAEAVKVFSRCPPQVGAIDIRPLYESADFDPVLKTEAGRALLKDEDEFRERMKR
jgi:hypothetical protein